MAIRTEQLIRAGSAGLDEAVPPTIEDNTISDGLKKTRSGDDFLLVHLIDGENIVVFPTLVSMR